MKKVQKVYCSRRNTSSQSSSGVGTVLGAATQNIPPASSGSIAYGGTALQPNVSTVNFDDQELATSLEAEASTGEVLGAEVSTTSTNAGFGMLFWIILILLLLVVGRYVYNRNKSEVNSY